MRMGVAQRVDRDAGREIEIARAVGGEQIDAFAALELDIRAGISRQDGRDHGNLRKNQARSGVMIRGRRKGQAARGIRWHGV